MVMSVFVKMVFMVKTVYLVQLLELGISKTINVSVLHLRQCGMELIVDVQLHFMEISVSNVHHPDTGTLKIINVLVGVHSFGMVLTVHVLNHTLCTNPNVSNVQQDTNGLKIDAKNVTVHSLISNSFNQIPPIPSILPILQLQRIQKLKIFNINVIKTLN